MLTRSSCVETTAAESRNESTIRVSLGTYKVFYEAGCEDYLIRNQCAYGLSERAKTREEERRRYFSRVYI
jgi:paired amphipathic helix protein Sin3a